MSARRASPFRRGTLTLSVAVPLAVCASSGCGDEKPDASTPPAPVVLDLELPAPAGGPPDGGLDQGHGQADPIVPASAGRGSQIRGRVTPADAAVEARALDGSTRPSVARLSEGRVRVVLGPARSGSRRYRVVAREAGRRSDSVDFRVVGR